MVYFKPQRAQKVLYHIPLAKVIGYYQKTHLDFETGKDYFLENITYLDPTWDLQISILVDINKLGLDSIVKLIY